MRLAVNHKSSTRLIALPLLLLPITGGFAAHALSTGERRAGIELEERAGISQEARPTSVRQAESTVRGRVLYADTRHPLRRAEVTLIEAETGKGIAQVATDRRGAFLFEHVPAGGYLVVADAPGIVSPRALLGRRDSFMNQIMLGIVKDGYAEVNVDGKSSNVEAEIRVRRGGVITGRITTEDGEPLAGANVKLFRRERGRLVQVSSTWPVLNEEKRALQTDARGVYRIAGLPSGEYVVRVSEDTISTDHVGDADDAYSDGSFVVAYYPSATSVKDAQSVRVFEGSESAGIDVRMPEQETHRIAGRAIFGREGTPAGFVEIKIDRKDEGPVATSLLDFNTRTDSDGKWEITGIPDGQYIVTVGNGISPHGVSPETGNWVEFAPRRIAVSVAGADVPGLETRLGTGASVSGTVVVEGGLLPRSELPGVEVLPAAREQGVKKSSTPDSLRDRQSQTASPRTEKALVPEDEDEAARTFVHNGAFSLKGLAAGNYYLRLSGISTDRFYVKAITRGGVDLMRSSFKLDEGTRLDDVRVVLATDLATVSGSVVAPAAELVSSGAIVMLAPADEVSRRMISELLVTRTDKTGRFTIRCPPGEYFIAAFTRRQTAKQTAAIDEDYFRKEGSKLRRMTLRAGEELKAITVPVIKD